LKLRSGGRCERCGGIGTVAHHISPRHGIYLCGACHAELDDKARNPKTTPQT